MTEPYAVVATVVLICWFVLRVSTMGVSASVDTQRYRDGYPGVEDDPTATKNARFYANAIKSQPYGDFIDNIHRTWGSDFELLERHHSYIQWLFPLRERGLNYDAQTLQLHEAQTIMNDKEMHVRVRRSYEMMLAFYGMRLVDKDTGVVERSEQWKSRYHHLSHSGHNWLRITRILKSLGELGYEHYKLPFLLHIIKEVYETGTLHPCRRSLVDYWAPVLRNADDQQSITEVLRRYEACHDAKTEGKDKKGKRQTKITNSFNGARKNVDRGGKKTAKTTSKRSREEL